MTRLSVATTAIAASVPRYIDRVTADEGRGAEDKRLNITVLPAASVTNYGRGRSNVSAAARRKSAVVTPSISSDGAGSLKITW